MALDPRDTQSSTSKSILFYEETTLHSRHPISKINHGFSSKKTLFDSNPDSMSCEYSGLGGRERWLEAESVIVMSGGDAYSHVIIP
jgi:hypothetical protein